MPPAVSRSARADGVAIALRVPTSRTSTALLPEPPLVAQQVRGAAVVGDQQIEIAVVVDVAGGQRAADVLDREPGSRLTADVAEAAAALVSQQQLALRLGRAGPEVARGCS